MNDADGCVSDRKIIIDGEVYDPIPFGDAEFDRTYEEVVEQYENDIADGGRGNLSVEKTQAELESFQNRWDPEAFDHHRRCHDCGAKVGRIHHPGCDMEECPACGGQYFVCDCPTTEKEQIWGEA